MLRAVDMLVLSKEDIAPAPDLEAAFAETVTHCIVTDGANGGTYYHGGEPQPYEAIPVKEIDPTGAGDVFAAALLAGLSQQAQTRDDVWQALNVARRLAAKAVTQQGSGHISDADVQAARAAVRGSDAM
jgi:sugar/nucleoside kinase (ribokinase family)